MLENSVAQNGQFQGKQFTSQGAYLSPELSFDGKTILFAYTDTTLERRNSYTWNENNTWHIFQVGIDGSYLTQLTEGPWDDFDPCFLPNGRVAFISERRGGFGRCHGRPVPSYTLHSMNADGSDIVMLSPHETNEWQPSVDHNGMIVYTRWDYVDRGFNQAHHPWITTPDGRDSRVIQGNFARNAGDRPHFEADIRAIPGSQKLVATASCHHGQAYGSLVIVDPTVKDDYAMGPVRRLTPDQLFPESECRTHYDPANYATAWPLSEDFYLCAYDAFSRSNAGEANDYGVYLIDTFGNRILLYRDPAISSISPMPLRSRPIPPVVSHATLVGKPLAPGEKFAAPDPEQLPKVGLVNLVNVYDSVLPWPADTKITTLRIVQLLPKTTPHANNPRIGYGDQKGARAILGTVPVEEDGSASFLLPVNIPVSFQALGADGAGGAKHAQRDVHPPRRDAHLPRLPRAASPGAAIAAPRPAGHASAALEHRARRGRLEAAELPLADSAGVGQALRGVPRQGAEDVPPRRRRRGQQPGPVLSVLREPQALCVLLQRRRVHHADDDPRPVRRPGVAAVSDPPGRALRREALAGGNAPDHALARQQLRLLRFLREHRSPSPRRSSPADAAIGRIFSRRVGRSPTIFRNVVHGDNPCSDFLSASRLAKDRSLDDSVATRRQTDRRSIRTRRTALPNQPAVAPARLRRRIPMSMSDLQRAFRLIDRNAESADFEGAKSEELVRAAEVALGLALPRTYREFVRRLGCGDIEGEEFYGVVKDDFENSSVPDGIWLTLNERKTAKLPDSMVIVADNGVGGWYAIDTSKKNADGDSPVVEWLPNNQPSHVVASDFGAFLLQRLRRRSTEHQPRRAP